MKLKIVPLSTIILCRIIRLWLGEGDEKLKFLKIRSSTYAKRVAATQYFINLGQFPKKTGILLALRRNVCKICNEPRMVCCE